MVCLVFCPSAAGCKKKSRLIEQTKIERYYTEPVEPPRGPAMLPGPKPGPDSHFKPERPWAWSPVRVWMIYITFKGAKGSSSGRSREEAKALAHKVAALVKRHDFVEMMKKYSDGPKGDPYELPMDRRMLEPVYKLGPGRLSDLIEYERGYLIFKRLSVAEELKYFPDSAMIPDSAGSDRTRGDFEVEIRGSLRTSASSRGSQRAPSKKAHQRSAVDVTRARVERTR